MAENHFNPYSHLLQQGLNLIGATDKFGNYLKEGGVALAFDIAIQNGSTDSDTID